MLTGNVSNKKVGNVQIFELSGSIRGSIAHRCQMMIQNILASDARQQSSVLIYTQNAQMIDRMAARALRDATKESPKTVIITRDSFSAETLLEHSGPKIYIVDNEEDAVFFLGKELAQDQLTDEMMEKRKFPRIPVALAVRGFVTDSQMRLSSFFCIANNLSMSGMFIRFLDSASGNILRSPWVQESSNLNFKLRLGPAQSVMIKGTPIHYDEDSKGMGIQFTEMNDTTITALKKFLDPLVNPYRPLDKG